MQGDLSLKYHGNYQAEQPQVSEEVYEIVEAVLYPKVFVIHEGQVG